MTLDFIIRPAQSEEEAKAAQSLDDAVWKNGYQHYLWLYQKDPNLLLVSVEKESQRFLGYVGIERIALSDLEVGYYCRFKRSMPPWNHDPESFHKDEGSIYHITGAAVIPEAWKEGVFERIMEELISRAKKDPAITMVASTFNLRHPTVRNPLKVWGKLGMGPIIDTYDPNWNHDGINHAKGTPDDGSIIFAIKTKDEFPPA